jgi:hypothetical protein
MPPPFIAFSINGLDRVRKDVISVISKRIETGTVDGDALGFLEELFSGWLEMNDDKKIYLHYIISRHKNEGNTQGLLSRWLFEGYDLRVVMPRPIMRHILSKFGFVPSYEFLPDHYEYPVEVWCRPAGTCGRGSPTRTTAWAESE